MRELGVELNEYTFSCLLKALAGARGFRHALLVKNGFIGSSVGMTCLIDLYFKCRKPRLACHLFDEMPHRDIAAWAPCIKKIHWLIIPRFQNPVLLPPIVQRVFMVGIAQLLPSFRLCVLEAKPTFPPPLLRSRIPWKCARKSSTRNR